MVAEAPAPERAVPAPRAGVTVAGGDLPRVGEIADCDGTSAVLHGAVSELHDLVGPPTLHGASGERAAVPLTRRDACRCGDPFDASRHDAERGGVGDLAAVPVAPARHRAAGSDDARVAVARRDGARREGDIRDDLEAVKPRAPAHHRTPRACPERAGVGPPSDDALRARDRWDRRRGQQARRTRARLEGRARRPPHRQWPEAVHVGAAPARHRAVIPSHARVVLAERERLRGRRRAAEGHAGHPAREAAAGRRAADLGRSGAAPELRELVGAPAPERAIPEPRAGVRVAGGEVDRAGEARHRRRRARARRPRTPARRSPDPRPGLAEEVLPATRDVAGRVERADVVAAGDDARHARRGHHLRPAIVVVAPAEERPGARDRTGVLVRREGDLDDGLREGGDPRGAKEVVGGAREEPARPPAIHRAAQRPRAGGVVVARRPDRPLARAAVARGPRSNPSRTASPRRRTSRPRRGGRRRPPRHP